MATLADSFIQMAELVYTEYSSEWIWILNTNAPFHASQQLTITLTFNNQQYQMFFFLLYFLAERINDMKNTPKFKTVLQTYCRSQCFDE
jgi:hypothetical protein